MPATSQLSCTIYPYDISFPPFLTKYLVVKKPSVSHHIPQHFFRDTSKVNISLSRQVVDCMTDNRSSMVPFREFWVSSRCYFGENVLTWIKFKAHGTRLVSSLAYLSDKSRLTISRTCWSSKPFPRHRLFYGGFFVLESFGSELVLT